MYRILIVDDEYYAREGIREMIRQIGNGFEVLGESPNAYHALEFMEKDCPDIVLADIHMPVMNGIELEFFKSDPMLKDQGLMEEQVENGASFLNQLIME